MVKLFLDISEIRDIFLSTIDQNTDQSNYLTVRDFRAWLFKSVNWLNYIYTDFGLEMSTDDIEFSDAVTRYDGIKELYETLKNSLDHPLLAGKTIISSFGYVYADILYFEIEVAKEV